MADDEHKDFPAQQAEQFYAIGRMLIDEAVSRLRAAELGAPEGYPKKLAWNATNLGLLIETEHAQYVVEPDAPIKPAEVLNRLLHPGWTTSPYPTRWC